jgi:hypothetical protein
MGSATLAGSLEYIENDGTVITETFDIDDTFQVSCKTEVNEAGAATFSVPFGCVVTGKCVVIKVTLGSVELLLDTAGPGTTINVGGAHLIVCGEVTQIDLKHVAGIEAEVTVLGDL